MATPQDAVRLIRWTGGQHPTLSNITRQMQREGLRPYAWENTPNQRYAVRSHGFAKIMYVVEGTLEVTFPDSNQRVKMRAGDRIEIPAGVCHSTTVGINGAHCVEASAQRPQTSPQLP
ncbi:MAG: cupin domain-containing protein [Chloroflexota bacterium]|nr:cupin domain-containing protein [Chloroflexota bacterium]